MKNTVVVKKIMLSLVLLIFPFIFSCRNQKTNVPNQATVIRDIEEIRESGKLLVVTDFNSINYFIYRGKPMGFQYDLLQELSDYLGIEIEVKVNNDLQANFNNLVNGDIDVIASNLTITSERREIMDFTVPHSQTRQVLVQRKEKKKDRYFVSESVIRNPLDLAGKTVYVQRNSSHATRIHNLEEEIGGKINVIEVPIETEQLIKMVTKGEIDYTIADEDIAKVNNNYYPALDVETVISFPQNQAWALRKSSIHLKKEIDYWLEDFRKTRRFAILHNKYFKSNRFASVIKSDYYYPETGKISRYDEILKEESEKIDWDWRLLASMIFQESRFNPKAISWAGAFGVMQLMPGTAHSFGVDINSSPEAHIRAGVRFINWLDQRLDDYVEDEQERLKFILASYNVGLGHVLDAIRLAEKYGKDPKKWEDNVEYFLLKKSDPKFFTDPVVRNGYARGTETYRYVRDIMYRYNHYLNIDGRVDVAQLFQ